MSETKIDKVVPVCPDSESEESIFSNSFSRVVLLPVVAGVKEEEKAHEHSFKSSN